MAPIVKESWEIDLMRQAGRIVAGGLQLIRETIRPGVSTGELDEAFEGFVRGQGAVPTFKGYRGFPASICASVNEEVVHGIPSRDRILREGDILSVDCGATFKGYVGDSAVTFPVGRVSDRAQRLLEVTSGALEKAIEAVGPGRRLSEVGAAVQGHAERHGFGVVRDYVGHGVGRKMHEEPQVPNYVDGLARSDYEYQLKPGIAIAIEPMLNEGTHEVERLGDGWTVVTKDRLLSAHFEHTVLVTEAGHEILTRRDR